MDATAWLLVAIAAVGCLLTSITLVVRVTNTIGELKGSIKTAVSDLKKEFDEENDKLRHELAETLKPIQTHISLYEENHYKLQLYIRDNYIEVDTFQHALGEIRKLIDDIKTNLKEMTSDNNSWRKEVRSKEIKS